jgi:ferric-dicitrate binding protein FerR (iron transport regulator)
MNEQLATELLRKYSSGECSAAEMHLVERWYQELIDTGELEWAEGEEGAMQDSSEQWLLQNMAADEFPVTPVRRLRNGRTTWWAAAAILIMLTGTVYYLYNNRPVATIAKTDASLKNDVAPGRNKAVLTLANGATIDLDDASNGMVAQQGNAKVLKPDDGQLVYAQEGNSEEAALSYNTLATPRSGQYRLVLPDGSKVWLNAESSIRYPVAFMGNERRVQITGEAYFEVRSLLLSSGQKMPFIVDISAPTGGGREGTGNMRVEVLGTHFNVNAYNDESVIKTTLLEGKVRVVNGESPTGRGGQSIGNEQLATLKPGQQAQVNKAGAIKVQNETDVEDVVAWKNGLFHFESAEIKTVMRQIARWYDVDVVYEGANVKNDPLYVEISRNTQLSDVLKVLEESGSAKFSIQGRTVIVK